MKKHYLKLLLLITFQLNFSQEKVKEITEVVINARTKIKKERTEFKQHAQSLETMDEVELNRNNPAFIEQSLSTMAGLQVEKRTNLGGQRFVLRGYGNDQKFNNWGIKMYWNNMPLTNAEGVTILDDVDFANINQVEIIKGPAATLYGAGTGGVVRFYSQNKMKEGTHFSQKLNFGSFQHFQSLSQLNNTGEKHSIQANFGHIESNGYRPSSGGLKNLFSLNADFKISTNQKINLLASQSFSDEKVAGQIPYAEYIKGNLEANTSYTRKNSANIINSTRMGIGHQWDINKNLQSQTMLFFSNLLFDRISAGAYETSSSPNYGLRVKTHYKKDFGNFKSQTNLGMEIQNSRSLISNYRLSGSINLPLETTGIVKSTYFKNINQQNNYFITENIDYKPWDLSLLLGLSANSVKYNRQDLFALPNLIANKKDGSFQKNYDVAYMPHFALQKTWKNQIFNLSYSLGYNAPTSGMSFVNATGKSADDLQVEKAQMWDFGIHGLLANTKFDYQISIFSINYDNKLSQLQSVENGANYNYWANTGQQKNQGFEASLGYFHQNNHAFISKIIPFVNFSYYDAKYINFTNKDIITGNIANYSGKKVVGVPNNKYAVGIDFYTKNGFYLNSTYNYLGDVYSDFENANLVSSYGLLNAKLGYQKKWYNWESEVFVMGNNLTNQVHYTYLFYGNNINDSDTNSNFGNQITDVNPGANKAYFFTGFNLTYHF